MKNSNAKRQDAAATTTTTTTGAAAVAEPSSEISDAVTLALEEPAGRTHSYLPYTNHAPDISKARYHLYCEDDDDRPANSLMTTTARMMPPNSASSQHLGSLITEPTVLNEEGMINNNNNNDEKNLAGSLTDLRRFNNRRQRKGFVRPLVLVVFVICLLLGLAFFFCWPRIPKIRLAPQAAAGRTRRPDDQTDWGPDQQHPWLRTSWIVNVTLDNHDNFIPTHVSTLELVLADQVTQQPFARSVLHGLTLSPRAETLLNTLFEVEYETPSIKDPTFEHLYNACGPQKISALASPALNITLQATFEIPGIAWKPMVFMDAPLPNGFRCPNN
ncbi:hypothetical protein BDB00DRAFT_375925 [Zychaea mexicana]|uniref:uncharacterized protein n=1 Tax=Zychaea mexicana TaxID=64656 RepID=UPI0022FE1317|nr:uncharacterized protein BDB00DRAFT_375925 [Zychaea mexicana]KAI9493326.1 hypothetical protein BDB00DRAFT_375925 [Zychaea mexicana]